MNITTKGLIEALKAMPENVTFSSQICAEAADRLGYFQSELEKVKSERDALIGFLEDFNILWNGNFPKFAREAKDKKGEM